MSHLALVALVVRDYGPAIDFFVNVVQFELVEDVPSVTNDGRPKRWGEPYGEVAVFLDIEGNRWDLLGPPATAS